MKKALATLLYQKYYSDAVIEKVNIDSAMVKAYYLSHPEDYKDKKLNDVYTLIVSKIRSDIVDTLRNNLFAELRNKYNPILNEELLKSILKENK